MAATSVPAPTNVPAAVSATLGDKKWKCLRPTPLAFHDVAGRLGARNVTPTLCNCVNLAGATSCACCKEERNSQLSVAVDS